MPTLPGTLPQLRPPFDPEKTKASKGRSPRLLCPGKLQGVDYLFVDHPSFPRPGGLYGDMYGTYGDNQVGVCWPGQGLEWV